MNEYLEELAELDKKGLLVRLPCKVGDTVYILSEKVPKEISSWLTVKTLNYDKIPKYFKARVVSFRISSKGKYVKLAVTAKHIVSLVYGDDNDTYNDVGEFCKISLPISMFGKVIFSKEADE